jgi:hypothetical protein
MKRITLIVVICIFGFLGTTIMAKNTLLTFTEIAEKLPARVQDWKKSSEGAVYNPKNLFKYINGGAELYISYNFKHLAAQTYVKEGSPGIKVDIFHMGSSMNAFGVFSHSRENVDRFVAPDVESEYAAGLLTFWKGPYYVSILAYPETQEKKNVVQKLARHIARLINEESRKPPIINRLPSENLVTGSIRYFRHYAWMNSHYFISNENILLIDSDTEAVLARYKLDSLLLLVRYPGPDKAEAAYRSFLENYLPGAREGFKQLEDDRWTGCNLDGDVLSIVFNAPALEPAKAILAKIKK